MSRAKRMATCHPDRPHFAKGMCKQCYYHEYNRRPEVVERMRLWYKKKYEENPEQMRERSRIYRLEHKDDQEYHERNRLRCLEYYRNNMTEEKRRRQYLKQHYSLTPEEYTVMLDGQGGRCAICGISMAENDKNFAVDHDHETGKIRGLLCMTCNVMLGNAQDNPEVLRNAALYLERNEDESNWPAS